MGEYINNYDKMSADASRLFLEYDQSKLLEDWPLPHDQNYIYIHYLDQYYGIKRSSGRIYLMVKKCTGDTDEMPSFVMSEANTAAAIAACLTPGPQAGFGPTLSILDMLTHGGGAPHPSGSWMTFQQLTNAAGSGPIDIQGFLRQLHLFDGHMDKLASACQAMGGRPVKGGDLSFLIPVFDNFPIWFQYWEADDEFPASLSILWDSTTPRCLYFETLWYICGDLADRLTEHAKVDTES